MELQEAVNRVLLSSQAYLYGEIMYLRADGTLTEQQVQAFEKEWSMETSRMIQELVVNADN